MDFDFWEFYSQHLVLTSFDILVSVNFQVSQLALKQNIQMLNLKLVLFNPDLHLVINSFNMM